MMKKSKLLGGSGKKTLKDVREKVKSANHECLWSTITWCDQMNTYPLFVWVNISNAKVVFLQQVEMVADEVEQVLSFGIPLKEKWYEKIHIMWMLLRDIKEEERQKNSNFIHMPNLILFIIICIFINTVNEPHSRLTPI